MSPNDLDLQTGDLKLYVCLPVIIKYQAEYVLLYPRLKCYYAFFLVCCGCDTFYIMSVHVQCQASIYTHFFISRAFMVDAASKAGDADSFRAPGLASGLQGYVNVHHGALLLVHIDSASVILHFT